MQQSDLIIIGGGIVGLATAYRFLERFPGKRVTVLEKEAAIARHQTGRNSGVLHTGIYYRPGSLKAQNCRAGKLAMEEFCRREQIPFVLCGKIIVAVDESELPRMETLLERGKANGVVCERIGPERIRELEPHAAGLAAIHIPEAGVVDYAQVARRLAELIQAQGSTIVTGARATGIRRDTNRAIVETTAGEFAGRAGRQLRRPVQRPRHAAQRRAAVGDDRAVPRRVLRAAAGSTSPGADADLPGARSELPVSGRALHAAHQRPSRVRAERRAGLCPRRLSQHDGQPPRPDRDARAIPASGGWRPATGESAPTKCGAASASAAFVRALQRLVPAIESRYLDWAPAGVRAQAVGRDGQMLDDFVIDETDRVVNVENAPSPAATASLNIGRLVVDRLAPRFDQ